MSDKTIIMKNPWGSEVRVPASRQKELESRDYKLVDPDPENIDDFTKKEILAIGKESLKVDYADKLNKGPLIEEVAKTLKKQELTEADFVKWGIEYRASLK